MAAYLALAWVAVVTVGCGGGGGGDGSGSSSSSVCGGQVSSSPVICDFSVSPSRVSRFGSITLRFGATDLEGDVTAICVGFALVPFDPVIACESIEPRGSTINEHISTDPVPLDGVLAGTYRIGFNVGDSQGHVSNTVVAQFNAF